MNEKYPGKRISMLEKEEERNVNRRCFMCCCQLKESEALFRAMKKKDN